MSFEYGHSVDVVGRQTPANQRLKASRQMQNKNRGGVASAELHLPKWNGHGFIDVAMLYFDCSNFVTLQYFLHLFNAHRDTIDHLKRGICLIDFGIG